MGEVHEPQSVLLIVAVISRYDAALDWARNQPPAELGPIALTSPAFDFTETNYYDSTMGRDLKKQFIAFEHLIDPVALARIKRRTNDWEAEYAGGASHTEPRPLNLDPGYITPAKLVLASTKDHAHRIYLSEGIYAELTLSYRSRRWQSLEWTYPDYRRDDFQQFFTACREWVLNCGARSSGLK